MIPPIPSPEKCAARRVRQILLEAEFSESKVMARLGTTDPAANYEDCLAQWLWRCRGNDPLSLLIRLFVIHRQVTLREASEVLGPEGLRDFQSLELLSADAEDVWARVELTPRPGFVFASDLVLPDRRPAADHVLGITSSASLVNRCMIRRPIARGLDLGTGSGFLALHMLAHCDEVIALDLNERALAFGRFNAEMNSSDGIEFRRSDRFSAVRGEAFHQIVGNLPFVISPAGNLLFRDGGTDGSSFFESVLREAPGHLTEGGFAQFLGQWSNRTPEIEIPDCDVLVLRFSTEPVHEYASQWVQPGAVVGREQRNQEYLRWMEFYADAGIEQIHTGLWTLRKRKGGEHWRANIDRPLPTSTWGDRIEQFFVTWAAWRRAVTSGQVGELRLRLSPYTAWRGDFPRAVAEPWLQLFSSDGFSTPLNVACSTKNWLSLCDGNRTFEEIARKEQLGSEGGWAALLEPLLFHGYLMPA